MRFRQRLLLFACAGSVALWLSASAAAGAAIRYRLVDLGVIGDNYTAGTWINRHGEVTGTVVLPDQNGQLSLLTAFTWSGGVRRLLPCDNCNPSGINDDGVVVGLFYGDSGFVYQNGGFTSVPHLPGADIQSDPWAINNSGEIWGTGYFPDDHSELWRLRDGHLRSFGTVVPGASSMGGLLFSPRRGVVGGGVWFPDGTTRGFVWAHGAVRLMAPPRGSLSAWPFGMNRNMVAVGYSSEPGSSSAVRFTAAGAHRLPLLPNSAHQAQARAINDHGLIVGADSTSQGTQVGIIWTHGRVIDLNRITRMPPGWHITFTRDVNNHGAITADATSPDNFHIVVLKPVR